MNLIIIIKQNIYSVVVGSCPAVSSLAGAAVSSTVCGSSDFSWATSSDASVVDCGSALFSLVAAGSVGFGASLVVAENFQKENEFNT